MKESVSFRRSGSGQQTVTVRLSDGPYSVTYSHKATGRVRETTRAARAAALKVMEEVRDAS